MVISVVNALLWSCITIKCLVYIVEMCGMFTCSTQMKSSIKGHYFTFSAFEVIFNIDDAFDKKVQYIR